MPEHVRITSVAAAAADVFAWLVRPGAVRRLVAPWDSDGAASALEVNELKLGTQVPLGRGFAATVRTLEPTERVLVLEQAHGPFASYGDELRVEDTSDDENAACRLVQRIHFEPGGTKLARRVERIFAHRHEQARRDVERLHAVERNEPLTVAVTGATGFLGTPLVDMLEAAGHRVLRVTRRPKRQTDIVWDPARGELDASRFDGVDAVINLAGENVAQRWTQAAKERIRSSRVDSTALLARTLASLERKPAVLVSASGAGYYGDTGEQPVDESAEPGEDFLAQVCHDWEKAAQPAREAGIRVAYARMGAVLGYGGGALAKLVPPVRVGLGGPLGSGRQYMAWMARDDVLGALHFLIYRSDAEGPFNLVAPQALRNRDVVRTLGRLLHRPTWLPAPAAAIKLLFGEMGRSTVLTSQHVRPSKLESLGFSFQSPTLEKALAFELGLPGRPEK